MSAARTIAAPPSAEAGRSAEGTRPDERAQEVGDDEADEADRAGDGGAGADRGGDADDEAEPQAGEADAERGGGVLAEGQRVEPAAEPEHQPAARGDEGRREGDVDERAVGERAHQPEDDLGARRTGSAKG